MRINKTTLKLLVVLISAIIVATVLFHVPITIVNAVTGQQAPEFGIHISVWRILFEPFLGLLLFFNQSFYAIKEFVFFLFWILAGILIFTVIKSFRIREGQDRKRFLFSQFLNLLLVAGIGFSVFDVMIFIPLPNNVIVNKSKNLVLVTTHSHTEYSHDGLISRKGLLEWHRRNRFDAFFITDHNNHCRTLEFVKDCADQSSPGYPNVFGGEEFSGTNHLSLLGLKNEFGTKGFSDSTAIQHTRSDNGAVIVNHWFDGEHQSLEYYRDLGVDGFEIENTATDKRYDRKLYQTIREFCVSNHLIMVGGLDYHGYGSACSIWNAFDVPNWKTMDSNSKETAILHILRSHDQSRLNVLLYNDRSYYSQKNLVLRTPLTIINYFRTLNLPQVISWIIWILLFAIVNAWIKASSQLSERYSCQRLIPVTGFIGAVFLLILGTTYLLSVQVVDNFTTMYHEYSSLLLKAGAVFLILSGFVAWHRMKKGKQIKK